MRLSYAGPDLSPRQRHLVSLIEWLTRGQRIRSVQQHFDAGESAGEDAGTFFRRAAEAFDLRLETWFAPRAFIPASGPLLVVANHPFGVVDGLAISALVETIRQDIRIIVWDAIGLPPGNTHFLPLDLSETGTDALRQNVAIRRKAIEHLRTGGCIVLFPSGSAEVTSHPLARPVEAPLTSMICKLALQSRATLLPVFVEGHNSRLFHAASHLGELIRRSLFLAETRRMIGGQVSCRIGEPLGMTELEPLHRAESGSNRQLASRLRDMTLRLGLLPVPQQAYVTSVLSGAGKRQTTSLEDTATHPALSSSAFLPE